MGDDGGVVAGCAGQLPAVPGLLLQVADDGALGHVADGHHVPDGQVGLLKEDRLFYYEIKTITYAMDLGYGAFLAPGSGSGMEKNPSPGLGVRDAHFGSYLRTWCKIFR